jgi:hypothetical protein
VKNGKLKVRLPLVTVSVGLNLDWF